MKLIDALGEVTREEYILLFLSAGYYGIENAEFLFPQASSEEYLRLTWELYSSALKKDSHIKDLLKPEGNTLSQKQYSHNPKEVLDEFVRQLAKNGAQMTSQNFKVLEEKLSMAQLLVLILKLSKKAPDNTRTTDEIRVYPYA